MKNYSKTILAIELVKKTDSVPLKRALELAKKHDSQIFLVHAVEYLSGYGAYGVGLGLEVEQQLVENAKQELKKLAKRHNIPEKNIVVSVGPAKFVILEAAEKKKAGLIVVGGHGHRGVRALLGATANGVLHGAQCDVLAVRLND